MTRTVQSFRIRAARGADAAAMPALEQSAGELFRNLPDLAQVADGENLSEQRYRTLVAGGWCRIAEDRRGDVCGFLCAERHGDELHICELAVRLDRQRLGIGRHLMTVTIRAARRRRIDSVTLTTFSDVAWNAPFYARLGFHRSPRRNMGARLRAVLRREVEAGLPARRRCAMRLTLASHDKEMRDGT